MTNEVLQKTASDEQNVSSSNGLEPSIRFPKFNENYKTINLSEYLFENKDRNKSEIYTKQEVLSVSGEFGIVNQIKLQGRSFAGESVKEYHIVETNDIVYTKSPLKANPYGIIKVNKGIPGIVSTLYAVYHVKNTAFPEYIDYYFSNDLRLNKYLKPLVNIGAKHDMKVNNETVLIGCVTFPKVEEQQKVSNFLSLIDRRIEKQRQLVESLKKYKRGLFLKLYNDSDKKSYKICDLGKYCATGALSKDDIDASGKYPCILYGELFTKYSEVIKQVASRTNIIPTYLSGTNEILFPSSTTADAQSLIFPSSLKTKNIFLGGDLFTIKLKNEFDSDFISYLVNFEYKNTLARYAQGITIIHLHYTDIKEQVIDIPNVDTQFNISSVMRKIETIIEMNINELNALLLMKKGFLQKMFI